MSTTDASEALQKRIDFVRVCAVVCFAGLLFALGYIQIYQHRKYSEDADKNRFRKVTLKPERGLVLDRRGRLIARSRPMFRLYFLQEESTHPWKALKEASAILGLDFGALKARYVRELQQKSDVDPIVVRDDLSLETIQRYEAHAVELPAFSVDLELVRDYLYGPSLAHALGYVGEVSERQLAAPAYAGCSKGEIVGKGGLEEKYDGFLRGALGLKYVVVNSRGKEIRDYGVAKKEEPGSNLVTTIDLELQEELEKGFEGKLGAGIVLDPRNGEILACFSAPSFDPNDFAAGIAPEEWNRLVRDPEHPLYNRFMQSKNSPGSVFKIILTAAGLQEGVLAPSTQFHCNGGVALFGDYFRCWKEGGHGTVDLLNGFKKSCNVYFYNVGALLGIDRIAKYARMFGLGSRTGVDMGQENPGLIPDTEWKRRTYGVQWYSAETVSVAIGQGAVGVTLLQLADVAAAVANEGVIYRPHFAREIRAGSGKIVKQFDPSILRKVPLSPSVWRFLKLAMWSVVNDNGTGSKARVEGFDVCGKTGTAQVAGERKGKAGAGGVPGNNSWFLCFAPRDHAEIVVAVFVPGGGHGGETAAPIAGRVLQRFFARKGEESGPPRQAGFVASLGRGDPAEVPQGPKETFR
jgi:penicillin-binding protein 2